MHKLLIAMGVLVALVVSSVALAAPPPAVNGNKLQCFSGSTDYPGIYGGTCALTGGGSAVLRTSGAGSNDPDPLNPNDSYAGVYVEQSNLSGRQVGEINKLSFNYQASGSTVATGGSPRISIPISVDGDTSWDQFAFIDVVGCNQGSLTQGTLDAINDPTCTVALSDGRSYPNWAAFVAANPTYRVASDTVTFVIVDQPGVWTISAVQLGRGSAKGK